MPIHERHGAVTYRGVPLTLIGPALAVGHRLPDAALVDPEWRTVHLAELIGKPMLISIVPSLDTGICDAQTRRFNDEAERLGSGATVVTISADLPWRQASWAKDAGVDRITLLSDSVWMEFGTRTGTHVKEMRIDMRAIVVADENQRVTYAEFVPEIVHHPDYDAAVDAARLLIKRPLS